MYYPAFGDYILSFLLSIQAIEYFSVSLTFVQDVLIYI